MSLRPWTRFRRASDCWSRSNGREIGIFNVEGEYFAVGNRCPHKGASLCKGRIVGLVEATGPGDYQYSRRGELLRCPWHGWEFDLRTGRSWCEPDRTKVRSYELKVEPGGALIEGELRAETFPVIDRKAICCPRSLKTVDQLSNKSALGGVSGVQARESAAVACFVGLLSSAQAEDGSGIKVVEAAKKEGKVVVYNMALGRSLLHGGPQVVRSEVRNSGREPRPPCQRARRAHPHRAGGRPLSGRRRKWSRRP